MKYKEEDVVWVGNGIMPHKATIWHAYRNNRHSDYCVWLEGLGEAHIKENEIIRLVEPGEEVFIDEEALDKAAREEYAVRCRTNGPRVLAEYASKGIMDAQLVNARVVVESYLKSLLKIQH